MGDELAPIAGFELAFVDYFSHWSLGVTNGSAAIVDFAGLAPPLGLGVGVGFIVMVATVDASVTVFHS